MGFLFFYSLFKTSSIESWVLLSTLLEEKIGSV